uniref:Myb/SANT-like domain-containing protein n=3 Tax=Aegilops tauschii subsp. strangulata TaxID=200361 RepID=A0A453ERY7_AEGTS
VTAAWVLVGVDELPPSWDPIVMPKIDMYPKGSPKYHLMKASGEKASHGAKKPSPKIKKTPPRVEKPRAQWNPALEKGLVEVLQEHNTPHHRGQNGWSTEAWNRMVDLFHERYDHTNFTKIHIQEKQKDLKAQYKLLKDARKQSGVSWNYHTQKIDADAYLWQNLMISWPEIAKFQNKPFPLYDKLGDLYDGHIAEGNFNFTSTEVTQVSDGDPEVEREQTAFSFDLNQYGDDLHMYNDPRDAAPSDVSRDAAPSDGSRDAAPSGGPRDVAQTGAPGGSNKKPVKEPKKKKRDDPMVGDGTICGD